MNFLITGGAGSVGRDLARLLMGAGHRVRILDKAHMAAAPFGNAEPELVQGVLEDLRVVRDAVRDIDAVIHLAWSFSDDPSVLLESDLKGHVALLEACLAARISRLFYASTAVVYGKVVRVPVTEEDPPLVEESRKPFYAIAKLAAEKLALAYGKTKELPVSVFRFWWSFGERIGGRHLRDMIALAQAGQPILVPEGAGGSFLDHDDLAHALLLALRAKASIGQVFNVATIYLEWQEIARTIIGITDSRSRLDVIPAREWKGAQFLSDSWELSTAKAERLFGYRSLFGPEEARQRLKKAVELCRKEMSEQT